MSIEQQHQHQPMNIIIITYHEYEIVFSEPFSITTLIHYYCYSCYHTCRQLRWNLLILHTIYITIFHTFLNFLPSIALLIHDYSHTQSTLLAALPPCLVRHSYDDDYYNFD
jgi:hypothetical protein